MSGLKPPKLPREIKLVKIGKDGNVTELFSVRMKEGKVRFEVPEKYTKEAEKVRRRVKKRTGFTPQDGAAFLFQTLLTFPQDTASAYGAMYAIEVE